MRLRTAKKILKQCDRGRENTYTKRQVYQACLRDDRTASQRQSRRWWDALMTMIGISGRVQILKKTAPDLAFSLLMRTNETEW